jgi:hypothetical protein
MEQIEVVKFERKTNNPIAKKTMLLSDWVVFKKFTKDYYYKAYQLGFCQIKID